MFERLTLDFYITLQTYQCRLVRANECPFNSYPAVLSVKKSNRGKLLLKAVSQFIHRKTKLIQEQQS